jgi:S1-C subfamily serine protease
MSGTRRSALQAVIGMALAMLFVACDLAPAEPSAPAGQNTGPSQPTAPLGRRSAPAGEVAGVQAVRPGSNPAALVFQRNQASVVTVASAAAVGTASGVAEVPQGVGSGFIIDDRGHIVTNNHVVEDADQLTVTFPDAQRTVFSATLVGRDPDNDLAVIRVDPAAVSSSGQAAGTLLRPVALGDSGRPGRF